MGKVNAHIQHFSTGEYSVAGMARVDQEQTRLAAETQENIFPHAIGKGLCRPGTTYMANTPDDNRARLLPFVREIDDTAILELTDGLLRVWVNDALITRPNVDSNIDNGGFDATGAWTLTASSGASATIVASALVLEADARGSEASAEQAVTTGDVDVQHALNINVLRGPVIFRVGSSSGRDDYISETTLDTGYHSLAFTPDAATYYVQFLTRNRRICSVASVEVASAGVMTLTAPWTTAQLRSIRFDQSADIVFLAHRSWRPRKIERRGANSWSVAEYHSDDGPFVPAPGYEIAVNPSNTFGNITITSDRPVFKTTLVGSLMRLYHDRLDASYQLAGDNTFTDVFTIRGIVGTNFNDRVFNYTTTGTWVGTARVQRSLTGPDGDFIDLNYDEGVATKTFTGNVTVEHLSNAEDNNAISYTRIGFIDGAYTSGTMTVAVEYPGASGYGVARITAYTNSTTVSAEVLEDFHSDTATRYWSIGAWSAAYGYPSAVAFFDGRLWWGGKDDFWASASDAYYTFDDLEEGDAATIQRKVATGGQVSRVNWFLPLQRLIIGTTGSEVSVRSSNEGGNVTPTNITLKDASTVGSASISPVKIDSRGVFVHRSGRKVLALMYSFDANDYRTDDLTELNDTICGTGIVELAAQREPETYVWCVREDGQVCILIYEFDEQRQAKGWSRFVTDGIVESVCTLPGDEQDIVYLAVRRTIKGNTVRFVERLALHSEATGGSIHKMADAGVFAAGPVSSVTARHLRAETGLVGWGTKDGVQYPLTGLTASDVGKIQLGDTYTNVFVGLPYTCKYKSARLAYGAQGGTALLQRKRVSSLGLLLADTHAEAVKFGPSFEDADLRNMDLRFQGEAATSSTVYDVFDDTVFAFPGDWNTDSRVCLQVEAPYPATFLGLVVGVETNEK